MVVTITISSVLILLGSIVIALDYFQKRKWNLRMKVVLGIILFVLVMTLVGIFI